MNLTNLITAIGISCVGAELPLNNTQAITTETRKDTTATTKSNIYNSYTYEDDQLLEHVEIATIEYKPITLNNIANVVQRAKITTTRDIENEDYHITINLLTKIEKATGITINNQKLLFAYMFPSVNQIDLTSEETYIGSYYKAQLTTEQQQFIEGANYTDITQLQNLNLNTGNYGIDEYIIDNTSGIEIDIQNYIYLETNFYIYYNGYQLNDQGAKLLDNKYIFNNIIYTINYNVNIDPSQYEVIDIPGLMFNILGMPFAWFSIAFDFTLFQGTPYAINISTLLLSLLVALIALVIFRIIMKGN